MKQLLGVSVALLLLGIFAACARTPASTPPSQAMADQVGGALSNQAPMEKLYEGAKKEGTVTVLGSPNVAVRDALTKGFAKAYPGIQLEYTGGSGNQHASKMKAEQQAGIYSVDVMITGTQTATWLLKGSQLIVPFASMLVAPDVIDPSNWVGTQLEWADKDQTMLAMLSIEIPPVVMNTDLVDYSALKSDLDLLDPKWKGKFAMNNPALPGAANTLFRRFYELHGEEFIRKMAEQKPVITNDVRQLVDWIAKGQYAFALGYDPQQVNNFVDQGITKLRVIEGKDWKEPQYVTPGFGGLVVPKNAPHPNASQLFVNWLLGKDGQTELSLASKYTSRRVDVPQDHVPSYARIRSDVKYLEFYTEESLTNPKENVFNDLVKVVFGSTNP